MRVDIYRRAEADGKFSHLAVPEGKPIPQEAINTDWQDEASARELDETSERWEEFGIERPAQQIREKGYAITSLNEQTD
ncbi:DUF6139 family protein [Acidovorax sp.]|jgi:hypothetical protein|uniref:DUF6139 family protein n=1 Tax=Acidovorax sp. TaxID=1872122 RepID=UPI0025C4E098|nr:DUF6139 family protein [Acidovorax sp.]MCI5068296.1 DUF6139 family protein [Acidovorax sp.]HTH11916.1 DUF6139 family protein [Acidovorax sp.]